MNAEEKLEIYNKALESCKVLKRAGVKVMKRISKIDEIYFKIKNMIQNFGKNKNQVKALNPARNIREELYNPEYTRLTNEVSKDYEKNEDKVITMGTEGRNR